LEHWVRLRIDVLDGSAWGWVGKAALAFVRALGSGAGGGADDYRVATSNLTRRLAREAGITIERCTKLMRWM